MPERQHERSFGMKSDLPTRNKSKNLRDAKRNKNDEFYTQLSDIEKELSHYTDFFKGKTVFCNCDDPYESNFFKYFALNFNALGLKKLIATSFCASPIIGKELSLFEENKMLVKVSNKNAYKVVMTELKDVTNRGRCDEEDIKEIIKHRVRYLEGDNKYPAGDFRSKECIELLNQADIVVTNPPFSLFREYVAQLIRYDKKFLIIGNLNAIAYKEIFPLIKGNKIWLDTNIHSGNKEFRVPDSYPLYATKYRIDKKGIKYISVNGIRWYTNVNYKKRQESLDLYKKYTPEEYPKYDNYDAINVNKVADIPMDYEGIMGVPISFMDKYCPDQFEIIGMGTGDLAKALGVSKNYRGRTDLAVTINGKKICPYNRILIQHKVKHGYQAA